MSTDGRVELVLRAPADGSRATPRTRKGDFSGPDYIVDVRVLGAELPAAAVGGS